MSFPLFSFFFSLPLLQNFCRFVSLISLVGSGLYVRNMAVRGACSLPVIVTSKVIVHRTNTLPLIQLN